MLLDVASNSHYFFGISKAFQRPVEPWENSVRRPSMLSAPMEPLIRGNIGKRQSGLYRIHGYSRSGKFFRVTSYKN